MVAGRERAWRLPVPDSGSGRSGAGPPRRVHARRVRWGEHVTEELLVGMLNRAAELGMGTEDSRFSVVKLENVHGISSGAPVPLKGAAVLGSPFWKGRRRKGLGGADRELLR